MASNLDSHSAKKPRMTLQEALKPEMENLRIRFPTLITMVLENVDDKSLVTFKETSREMHDFLDKERFYWIRILRRYNGCFVEFWNSWKMVIEKNSVEMVREIAMVVEKFFSAPVPFPGLSIPRNTRQWAPLFIAAHLGNLSFFKYIFHKTNNEYPIGHTTALHLAAQLGHLEICQYIVNNTSVDIRITDRLKASPIHLAAMKGHLDIFNFLIEKFDLESCKDYEGTTTLHMAAIGGHLEMCKLLIGKMQEKSPVDDLGWTPLHFAAESGHGEVCKLLAGYMGNKNPVGNDGFTPRQLWKNFARDLFRN